MTCQIPKIVHILPYICDDIVVCLIRVTEFLGDTRRISSEGGGLGTVGD